MSRNTRIYIGGKVNAALKGEFMRELKRMNAPTARAVAPRVTQTMLLQSLLVESVEHRRTSRSVRGAT